MGDPVVVEGQAGGFQVKDHKLPVQRLGGISPGNRHHIVHKIGLHAIDQLEVGGFIADGVGSQSGLGEALHHAVVGDGHGTVAHPGGHANRLAGVAEAVHTGQLGVQVQFHPLFGGVVLALFALHHQHVVGMQHILLLVVVVPPVAPDDEGGTVGQSLPFGAVPFFPLQVFDHDGTGVVGDGDQIAFAVVALDLLGEYIAPHHHLAAVGLGEVPAGG